MSRFKVLPILFNTEMVRANLDGRKSCTRRLVKGFVPDDAIWGYTAFTPKGYAKQLGTVEEYIDTIYNILMKRNWLVVFFNGKYPQIPMKLRKEIFIYITENYTGLEPFEYSPETENKGKWRLLFEEQTLDPKEIGYHIQFIKDMFLLFVTIWLFKYILTLS